MMCRRGLRAALAVLLLLSAAGFASAQQPQAAQGETDCAAAAWSLEALRARLAAPDLPEIASGAALDPHDGAAVLVLRPVSDVAFAHPPERRAAPGTFAGTFTMFFPTAGLWQVTLSEAAWVDLVADGHLVPATAFTGVHRCSGVRKSLRFQTAAGAIILQISGASTHRVRAVITPLG